MGNFNSNLDAQDAEILEKASDFSRSNSDQALGKKLNLISQLPEVLSLLSELSERYTLTEISTFPKEELEAARNDFRYPLAIGENFYEATSAIFGPEAFGLRLVAWLARNLSPDEKAIGILGIAALRRGSDFLLDSQKISGTSQTAEIVLAMSSALQKLQKMPEFSSVLSQENLRRGLSGVDENWTLQKQIEAAKIKKE